MKVALADIIAEVVTSGGKTSVKEISDTAINAVKKSIKK